MNEYERKSYLDAMGIEVFYLKKSLSNAKASPDYDFPELFEQASANVEPSAISQPSDQIGIKKSAHVLSHDLKALSQSLDQKQAVTAVVSRQEKALQTPENVPAPRQGSESGAAEDDLFQCQIRYYLINAEVAVIDELPTVESAERNSGTVTLLRNILVALNVECQHCEFQFETLTWPLASGIAHQGSGKEAAAQMLNGFLAQRQSSDGFNQLFVFAGSDESVLTHLAPIASKECSATVVSSSLTAMLALPSLKRQVWGQLKPLRKQIS